MTMQPNPQQPLYVYVQKPPSNGLAVAGLVLGITGAVLALIPLVGVFLCWLPALLAIIFGFIGIATANRTGLRKTEAIWAVVLGFSPPVIIVAELVIAIVVGGSNS